MNDTTLSVTPETLPSIVWQNQPVITTDLLAQIYETAVDNIKVNFNNNKARFIEGVHYHLLKGADLKAFKSQVNKIYPALIHKFTTSLYLWTERGTVRHAKILDTDNAWAVQEKLEDFYFSKRDSVPYGLKDLPPEKINPEQRQLIRHAVAQIAGKDKIVYQQTFWRIHEHFSVNSYKELNACDFDKVMELLGKPQQKMTLVPTDELADLMLFKQDAFRLAGEVKALELQVQAAPELNHSQFSKAINGEVIEKKNPNVKDMTYHEWLNVVDKMNAGDLMLFKRIV